MKKLDLNFRKAGKHGNSIGGVMILLAGVMVAIWIAKLHNDATAEQHQIQSSLDRLQNSRASSSTAGQTQDAAVQYQRAASIIDQLSFPWDRLFQAIEKNTTSDIALLSIQPNMEAKSIVLDAESKNWAGMLNYIKRLEGDGFFSDVHLVSHQTQQSDPQRPVRFRLTCQWSASQIELSATSAVAVQ